MYQRQQQQASSIYKQHSAGERYCQEPYGAKYSGAFFLLCTRIKLYGSGAQKTIAQGFTYADYCEEYEPFSGIGFG